MDPTVLRELDRLVDEGMKNNASWEFVERRIRKMVDHLRRLNGGMSPTDQQLADYLEGVRSTRY